jgi:hypothetical protein
VAQLPRAGEGARGEQVGANLAQHQGHDDREQPHTEGDEQHPDGQRGPRESHEGRETDRTDEAVHPDAEHRVASTEVGAGQPMDAPQVRPDVTGGEQAQQLRLGVGPEVPAAGQAGVGEHAPPQRAQDVLADHPGKEPEHDRPQGELREPGERDHRHHDADHDAQDEQGPGVEHGT